MNAAVAADIPFDSQALTERLVRQLKVAAEDWFDQCRRLSEFEERYLMDEPLDDQALKRHALALNTLEVVGRFISHATKDPQFPDQQFAGLVSSVIQDLRDRRAMWHTSISPDREKQILLKAFNEV
jgi:hypothetical protein